MNEPYPSLYGLRSTYCASKRFRAAMYSFALKQLLPLLCFDFGLLPHLLTLKAQACSFGVASFDLFLHFCRSLPCGPLQAQFHDI
jgi:hypothetical protein